VLAAVFVAEIGRSAPLDRLIAGMAFQPAVDAYVTGADLAVVDLDQVTQRGDPG
jgi:hypothetical protein